MERYPTTWAGKMGQARKTSPWSRRRTCRGRCRAPRPAIIRSRSTRRKTTPCTQKTPPFCRHLPQNPGDGRVSFGGSSFKFPGNDVYSFPSIKGDVFYKIIFHELLRRLLTNLLKCQAQIKMNDLKDRERVSILVDSCWRSIYRAYVEEQAINLIFISSYWQTRWRLRN